MKSLRILSLSLLILCIAFFAIGIVAPPIDFDYTLKIQAPIGKAYNAMASHDYKGIIYKNINAESADVQDFIAGNTTFLEYSSNGNSNYIKETILVIDSLSTIIIETLNDKYLIHSKIEFQDNDLLTYVKITEKLKATSWLDRPFTLLLKNDIKSNRIRFYEQWKTHIESTPDYHFLPEEQK